MAVSAQWLGSTTTSNLVYRDGNVVLGGTSISGTFGASERILQIQSTGASWLSLVNATGSSFALNAGSKAGLFAGGNAPMAFYTQSVERMRITPSGSIAIGTSLSTNPNGYKLAVNGSIGAKEVQIENSSSTWADYVFDSTYILKPLFSLETFIKENKHLPEIPSAEEVRTNGHKLGEMDILLLKKVEELTLYMIEMNKKLEAQSQVIGEQQEMILELKARQK